MVSLEYMAAALLSTKIGVKSSGIPESLSVLYEDVAIYFEGSVVTVGLDMWGEVGDEIGSMVLYWMVAGCSGVGVTRTVTYTIRSVVFTDEVVVQPADSITAIQTKRINPVLFCIFF